MKFLSSLINWKKIPGKIILRTKSVIDICQDIKTLEMQNGQSKGKLISCNKELNM